MKQLIGSFSAAMKGVRNALAGQRNLKIHTGASLLVIAAGIYVDLSLTDWSLVALAIGLVWVAEMMNTAIETFVDLVQPQQHPLAGKAKDIAAGGVLLAAVIAVVIGFLVFSKYLVVL